MAIERTFSIIKPDAVAKNVIGPITGKLEAAGLRVIASRMTRLTEAQARAFYAVHKDRPFYGDLVKFMTEGPVVVQVLEGESAIARNRRSEEHTSELQSLRHIVCSLLLEKKKVQRDG